jgi:hypothetical protein
MAISKRDKKLLLNILKSPKLPKSNKETEIVLSPTSYARLFEDLGPETNIKIRATKLKRNQKRKVV